MTRFTSSTNATAANGMHVPYVLFGDFDFASGHLRCNSSDRSYVVGGNTYTPFGRLVGVGEVKESAALSSEKLEFTLSGVDNSLITTVRTEKYHGRSMTLYVGFCDANWSLVAAPEILWEGRMDTMSIHAEQNGATITLVCESRLVIWNQASGWRYTDEHQQLISPGDVFFDKLSTLVDKIVKWGDLSVNTGQYGPIDLTNLPPASY